MEEQKISFNKEAADTLGIESAIILELYKSIKFNESLDEVDLFKVIKSECSFMSDDKIKSNFEKLKKLKLITFNSNKTHPIEGCLFVCTKNGCLMMTSTKY